jgi:epoxyqueuosine reductase QueG
VITNASLEPDRKLEEPVCKKDECNKCVEYCRSGALKPYGYNIAKCMMQMGILPPIELLKKRDEKAIDRFFAAQRGAVLPGTSSIAIGPEGERIRAGGCGMCVIACPIGRKYVARPKQVRGTPSISFRSEIL